MRRGVVVEEMFGQEVNSAVVKPAQTLTLLAKNGELDHVPFQNP